MAVTQEQFHQITLLVEDGELDDYMIELQGAIDERNARRKDDILKLVKSVWGHDAQIVADRAPNTPAQAGTTRAPRAPVPYEPDAGPQVPSGAEDSMGAWPTPIQSAGVGDGSSGGTGFEPVRDPMVTGGGSDPFGDNNPDVVSTGAQIGGM